MQNIYVFGKIEMFMKENILNEKIHALGAEIKCLYRQNLNYNKMLAVHI